MGETAGKSFSLDPTWERIQLLLDTPGLPADQLRTGYLEELRRAFTAAAGALLPIDGSSPQWDEMVTVGESTAWRSHRGFVREALSRAEQLLRCENPGSVLALIKLELHGKAVAAVLLQGSSMVCPAPGDEDLARLGCLLAQIEHGRRFRLLLAAAQQKLRELRKNSERIAKSNQKLFQQLHANQDRLRSISQGVLRVQENERSKISRELHDGLGQGLTALKINLDLLAAEIEDGLSTSARDRLADTRSLASEAIEEVRELSRLLRPRMLDELGLSPTLTWYARTFGKRTGLQIELDNRCHESALSWEIETLIFRVTQEALNNVVKHSGADRARVRLRSRGNGVDLEIADSGRGFDPTFLRTGVPSGSGLAGIRDRVSLLGGKLSLQSQPGQGTIVRVRIPRREAAADAEEDEST